MQDYDLDQFDQYKDMFKDFIRAKKIAIVDENFPSCRAISKAVQALGGQELNIRLFTQFKKAEKELTKDLFHLVIVNYDLGTDCGLHLIDAQRSNLREDESMFVVVTENNSQAVIARAAEEHVDTFVFKPFSHLIFEKRVIRAAAQKFFSNSYHKKVLEGKDKLATGAFKEALEIFESTKSMNPSPALAFYYSSRCLMAMDRLDDAEKELLKGLKFNRIHFKCLEGLYELYIATNKLNEAYNVLKRLAYYYPTNQKRLTQVVRLAVITNHVDDIERYYHHFSKIENKNEELVRYVTAGLLTCAKYYLQRKATTRASDLFQKVSELADRKPKILLQIIVSLTDYEMGLEAKEYLNQFSKEDQSSSEYRISRLVLEMRSGVPQNAMDMADHLIDSGVFHPLIYKAQLLLYRKFNRVTDLESSFNDAIERFPELKKEFTEIKEGREGKLN